MIADAAVFRYADVVHNSSGGDFRFVPRPRRMSHWAAHLAVNRGQLCYSRLPVADFARGLALLLHLESPPVAEVVVCLRDSGDAEELVAVLAACSSAGNSGGRP